MNLNKCSKKLPFPSDEKCVALFWGGTGRYVYCTCTYVHMSGSEEKVPALPRLPQRRLFLRCCLLGTPKFPCDAPIQCSILLLWCLALAWGMLVISSRSTGPERPHSSIVTEGLQSSSLRWDCFYFDFSNLEMTYLILVIQALFIAVEKDTFKRLFIFKPKIVYGKWI